MRTDRQTDRHDEANSRFSQFCESAYKRRAVRFEPFYLTGYQLDNGDSTPRMSLHVQRHTYTPAPVIDAQNDQLPVSDCLQDMVVSIREA
jgi:hypothetical protein